MTDLTADSATDSAPDPATDPGPDVWAIARDAYLAGATGVTVCRDLGLKPSTFWRRAAEEEWLRRDRAPASPQALDMQASVDTFAEAAEKAWRRAVQALDHGRSAEAHRWMRMHQTLMDLHRSDRRQRRDDSFEERLAQFRKSCEAGEPGPVFIDSDDAIRQMREVESVFRDSHRPAPPAPSP